MKPASVNQGYLGSGTLTLNLRLPGIGAGFGQRERVRDKCLFCTLTNDRNRGSEMGKLYSQSGRQGLTVGLGIQEFYKKGE